MEYFLTIRTALLVGVAALAPVFCSGQGIEAPDPVKAQEAKVVRVLDREGDRFWHLGTGFMLVRNGTTLVVTNDHVVGNAKSAPWISIGMQARRSQLIVRDEDYDLAILKIDRTDEGETEERVAMPRSGMPVYAYGFPDDAGTGVDPVISSGQVLKVGQYSFVVRGLACRPGASGGLVLDGTGAIVGYMKGYSSLDAADCVCVSLQKAEDLNRI